MDTLLNPENLLYRRQFILGCRPISSFSTWKTVPFGSLHLTVHPDLEVTISKRSNNEFILLGFALNHMRPQAGNQEILDELADTCHCLEDMHEYCRDLCGRYLILFNISDKSGILTDLIASRTVYYCSTTQSIWCASQPSTLAKVLKISRENSPHVRTYIEKEMYARGEGSWIGDGSMYEGVRHLLPNHYLDLQECRAIRYWPVKPRLTLDLEKASQISATILENTMRAATNRFNMSMAITSGWDSRCLLAASRNVRDKVYYYIQKFGDMTDNHPDIRVPRKLTQKIRIPFHVIDCPEYQNENFDTILKENVFILHNTAKKVLYWNFFQHFQGRVNASGNISDLCRTAYGCEPINDPIDLLWYQNLSESTYAKNAIEDWFLESKTLCNTLGYNLRDLFFWEQALGNWGSMFAAELDIAIDEFYPFGTRRLVETILAVDESLRPYENSQVHRRIIELLWPELLSQPINPISWRENLFRFVRNAETTFLSRLGLLSPLRRLRSRLRDKQ